MAQPSGISKLIFYSLFMIALVLGGYAYVLSQQSDADPIRYMLNLSGYRSIEAQNQKKIQDINDENRTKMLRLHQRMDEVDQQQKDFLKAAQDQQKINQQIQEEQMQHR